MSLGIDENFRRHGFKRLLLAVSGGLDSICLAHYFACNRESLGIEWLGIAHVHHGLREKTADRDAAFVKAFAESRGLPFYLKTLDGEALKAADGSLEENARDARYRALLEIAKNTATPEAPRDDRVHRPSDPIASSRLQDDTHIRLPSVGTSAPSSRPVVVTAHHAGDQAETLYMRLRRGTTLAGLRGIQDVRALDPSTTPNGFAQDDTQTYNSEIRTPNSEFSFAYLYRPLLNVTRAELLAYARENRLEWCEDESNADVKFARNRIRHERLPQLEQSNNGATRQLCKIAGLANKAYGKVMEKCDALFNPALRKESLRQVQDDTDSKETPACAGTANKEAELVLDKKTLRKVLLAHADADLSEMFRLWLSERGFRFPVGFFFDRTEPAHVKIPHRAAYRRRSVIKNGATIRICEFDDVASALKFVSCK